MLVNVLRIGWASNILDHFVTEGRSINSGSMPPAALQWHGDILQKKNAGSAERVWTSALTGGTKK